MSSLPHIRGAGETTGTQAAFFRILFRALGMRNFRIYFLGQTVSLIGTWMQQIAMSWLVYRLTGSALLLGVVGFATQIPAFFLSPIAGVLADRWNRRRLLICTQSFSMLQALALAALTLTGHIAVWHILVLGVLLGCVNALDATTRQSFVIELVEKKALLGNAIALNSLMFNSARLIGPSIAGIVIAAAGEGVCFLLNGVSFLAVLASLFSLALPPRPARPRSSPLLRELYEGVRYINGFTPIRAVLILLSVINLMGMSFVVLMPVFAKQVLHGGPGTLGFLMAAVGLGALAAALLLASQTRVVTLGRILPYSAALFACGFLAFAWSHSNWLSVPLLVLTGFGFMMHTASANTILQTLVEDDKRGRVMSFYTMAFMGMAPLGSLLAGGLAQALSAPAALTLGALTCLAASLVFFRRVPELKAKARPVYERLGILSKPPVVPEDVR